MADSITVSPHERLVKSVSTPELERRWKATREMMREHGLDYLVIQNHEEFLGGTMRWLTDFAARHQYPMTVIFPVDDEMTMIACGLDAPAAQVYPPPSAARGVKEVLGAGYFATIQYTNTYDAELAVGVLNRKRNPKIGWVEKVFIPVTFHDHIVKNLPGASFVEATEWLDRLKAIKSTEELELIQDCAVLQDGCMQHLSKTIKPGMHDYEVYAEAHYFCSLHGSSRGIVQVGSGPLGAKVPFDFFRMQNRVIREGDQVSVLIEVNGPGGYYSEAMRTYMVGAEPSPVLQEAWAAALECEKMIAAGLVPGADPKELWQAYVDFMVARDYAAPVRSFAHGQGLSLFERPNIRPDETWKIEEGMNIAVHPVATRDDVLCIVCDGYIVEKGGGRLLHKMPMDIIVV